MSIAKRDIKVGLDPNDPRVQVLHIGDYPGLRLRSKQARQLAAKLLHYAEQQERHEAGARIVLPTRIERLQ